MKEARHTCYRMMIVVGIAGIVFAIAGAVISGQYIIFPIGVLAGCLVSVALIYHLFKSAATITQLPVNKAKSYGRGMSVLRILIMGTALLVACYYYEYISPWGVLLGLLTLKISAYTQHFIKLNNSKGDEGDNAGSVECTGKKA